MFYLNSEKHNYEIDCWMHYDMQYEGMVFISVFIHSFRLPHANEFLSIVSYRNRGPLIDIIAAWRILYESFWLEFQVLAKFPDFKIPSPMAFEEYNNHMQRL